MNSVVKREQVSNCNRLGWDYTSTPGVSLKLPNQSLIDHVLDSTLRHTVERTLTHTLRAATAQEYAKPIT